MTSGILIGFAVGLGVVALAALLYLLYRLSGQIDEIGRQVEELLEVNCETQKILQKLADQTTTLRGLINAFGRSVAAMEQTTQAIRGLSGLLIAPGTGEAGGDLGTGAVETLWQRGAPPNPLFDRNAPDEEAGYLSQTDEDLAEIERQNTLREMGVETDPLRIAKPDQGQINFIETGTSQ